MNQRVYLLLSVWEDIQTAETRRTYSSSLLVEESLFSSMGEPSCWSRYTPDISLTLSFSCKTFNLFALAFSFFSISSFSLISSNLSNASSLRHFFDVCCLRLYRFPVSSVDMYMQDYGDEHNKI